MLLAFNSSLAMFISIIATFLTGVFIIINSNFALPIPLGIALIILSGIGLAVLLSSVPKLYNETLKRCSDDINGFAKEQKAISKRCFGKKKLDVLINLIFGLTAYERLDEAESLLMQTAPLVDRKGHAYKMKYLFFSLLLSGKRKDNQSCAYMLERLMNELQTNRELFILEKDEYEHLAQIIQLETAFYSLNFSALSENDKEMILKLNFLARKYLSLEHFTNELWNEYFTVHLNYILGITYLIMGDNRSAEFYLGNTANQPFTYPENTRARYFLQTKDMKTFF